MTTLPNETRKTIAKEILLIQKTVGYSLVFGIFVTAICLVLFNPFKFDGDRYQHLQAIHSPLTVDLSTPSYFPAWWVDGFFDYCDGEGGFNPEYPQESYSYRKQYLVDKSIRYGLWSLLICFGCVTLFRYGTKGQKWLIQNAGINGNQEEIVARNPINHERIIMAILAIGVFLIIIGLLLYVHLKVQKIF